MQVKGKKKYETTSFIKLIQHDIEWNFHLDSRSLLERILNHCLIRKTNMLIIMKQWETHW